MNDEWQSRYDCAIKAAQAAGKAALQFFPDPSAASALIQVNYKSDASPVTIADRQAEQQLRTDLLGHFPHDGFLGEEFGEVHGSSGFRWIVDPIDGTRSFVRGIPLWATLVGLEHDGRVIAGVVYEPVSHNLYRALAGHGAFKNDHRIQVSKVNRLADAILATSDFNSFDSAGEADVYISLARRVQKQRGYGDYFGFTLVAQGSIEIMLDCGVQSWDVAAIVPIIQEAGGRMTSWSGGDPHSSRHVIASNGLLHGYVLRALAREDTAASADGPLQY